MKRNLRQEMLDKTASMRSTTEVQEKAAASSTSTTTVDAPRVPRTAPGQLAALTAAQERIKQLESAAVAGASRKALGVELLERNPWQPRKFFDQAALDDLGQNMDENGQLQPIVARPHPTKPGRYQIAMGERRWLARKLRERPTVDVVIVDYTDQQMAVTALCENIHREELSDYEVSQSLAGIEEVFPRRKDVAEAVGISRTQLHRLTAFQKLPAFMREDLDERPRLLGASAAGDIVSALKRYGDESMDMVQELWTLLKQGELDQADIARRIEISAEAARNAAAGKKAVPAQVRLFYREGNKAADLRRDGRHLMIRVRNDVLDEGMEKRIREFMDSLFPPND